MKFSSKFGLVYEILFLFLIFSFLLTLGSDRSNLLNWRMVFGAGLIAAGVFLFFRFNALKSFSLISFSALFLYEAIRAGVAFSMLHSGKVLPDDRALFQNFAESGITWFFYWGFFAAAYLFFSKKSRAWHLLNTLAVSGFFLALNAIPPLLKTREQPGYAVGDHWTFFHPVFYFHPWIEKYVTGTFAHLNYVGDVIAIGFFAAAGIVFYTFQTLRDRWKSQQAAPTAGSGGSDQWAYFFLVATQALAAIAAVVLFFSRGTISFMALTLFLFIAALIIKFPSKGHRGFTVLVVIGIIGFLFWAGNLQNAIKEVGTLQEESGKERGSLTHNQEGAARALRIYEAYPMWGVGTGGYSRVAVQYASPNTEDLALVDFQAMSHYLQLLAEEGKGAFLYFLFLLAFLGESLWGFLQTKSRFKFVAALSLFASAFLILTHASINHLMERFPIAVLVSVCMGASLAVLRSDFQHE